MLQPRDNPVVKVIQKLIQQTVNKYYQRKNMFASHVQMLNSDQMVLASIREE